MNQQWDEKFQRWAKSPSQSETERCENAEGAIREAIKSDSRLVNRDIRVFTQGSYRNRTNVRRESDVDVGILCLDTFFYDPLPEGTTESTFGIVPATYHYEQFKNDVGQALVNYFGVGAVTRGNKAFDIKETGRQVEADVAPFFEHRRYSPGGSPLSGVELRPDNGNPPRVINWPEQHYKNGVAKNDRTSRSYKALVRILKSLRNEMDDNGVEEASPIIGFLSECLIWNVPDSYFSHLSYGGDLEAALTFLYNRTKTHDACKEWGEVSELNYLFHSSQKWTRQQAHDFILAAWQYVDF